MGISRKGFPTSLVSLMETYPWYPMKYGSSFRYFSEWTIFRNKKKLFKQPVVRRFIGDQDIVGVALGHSGVRDTDKLCFFLHICNCF